MHRIFYYNSFLILSILSCSSLLNGRSFLDVLRPWIAFNAFNRAVRKKHIAEIAAEFIDSGFERQGGAGGGL